MFIYVSGPYSPPKEVQDKIKRNNIIENNIENANYVALQIVKKGHIPFIPHTMMRGWEDKYKVNRILALEICHKWIQKCDALYFIAPSNGANSERDYALKLNLPIYYNLNEIPINYDE